MKLRNKKTGEIVERDEFILIKHIDGDGGWQDGSYHSIAELNADWEDYTEPTAPSKYYLINEETGYVLTFDSEDEMNIFEQEIKGWRQVKVLLDDEDEE